MYMYLIDSRGGRVAVVSQFLVEVVLQETGKMIAAGPAKATNHSAVGEYTCIIRARVTHTRVQQKSHIHVHVHVTQVW